MNEEFIKKIAEYFDNKGVDSFEDEKKKLLIFDMLFEQKEVSDLVPIFESYMDSKEWLVQVEPNIFKQKLAFLRNLNIFPPHGRSVNISKMQDEILSILFNKVKNIQNMELYGDIGISEIYLIAILELMGE